MAHLRDLPAGLLSDCVSRHESTLSAILASLSDGPWSFQRQSGPISLYFRHVADSPFVQTKTVVSLPVPKEAMIDVMTYGRVYTLETTPQGPIPPDEIYALYDGGDDHETVLYFMAMAPPAPLVAPREFLLLRRTCARDGATVFVQMSVESDELKPRRKGFVRGTIHGQAFVIRGGGDGATAEMTVFSHVDPGGRLPVWAVNYSVKNQLDGIRCITEQAVARWRRDDPE
jgi:hypothetical protein